MFNALINNSLQHRLLTLAAAALLLGYGVLTLSLIHI